MVNCEGCKKQLHPEHMDEVKDNTGKIHLVCTRCKKLSGLVLSTFNQIEWPAFIEFVKRYDESHKDYKVEIPISKEPEKPPAKEEKKEES